MKIGIDARNLVTPLSGIGRYLYRSSQALAERGHEIILYCSAAIHSSFPSMDHATVRTSHAQTAASRLVWGQKELPRQAAQDRLDIFWGPAHRLPIASLKTPKVLTIHDLVWRRAPQTMRWRTYLGERLSMPSALRAADLVLAISDATRKDIEREWPQHAARIRRVYPGHDFISHDDPNETSDASSGNYLLFVGTLEPRKNLERLLLAWKGLHSAERNERRLVIVGGSGWGRSLLDGRADGSGQAIEIRGFVSDVELRSLYRHAAGLVMPSLYEGFGLPIVEAQANGVSVLVSNVSSLPEVAGPDAVLVDPLDVESITNGLRRLLAIDPADPGLRRRARANAERFSWSRMASELEHVFDEARERR